MNRRRVNINSKTIRDYPDNSKYNRGREQQSYIKVGGGNGNPGEFQGKKRKEGIDDWGHSREVGTSSKETWQRGLAPTVGVWTGFGRYYTTIQ